MKKKKSATTPEVVVSEDELSVVPDDDGGGDNSSNAADKVVEYIEDDDEMTAEKETTTTGTTILEDQHYATTENKNYCDKNSPNFAWKGFIVASNVLNFFIVTSVVIIFVGTLLQLLSNYQVYNLPLPTKDLQSFVSNERSLNKLHDETQDLETDDFRKFAQSFCGSAPTLERAKANVRLQLSDLPLDIQDKVVTRALVEEVTQKNIMQDSTAELTSNGNAASFMAFWSTVYNPNSETAKYDTCIMIAGIKFKAAEVVASYKETTKKVIIGSEPCNCGYTYCETCPIVDTQVTKTPIFKRHSLSLKKQEELHRWMVKSAVDAAEAIVGRSVIGDDHELDDELAWEKDKFETN